MSKQEIEVIVDEIVEAINQGRFNEACRKYCETQAPGLLDLIWPKVARYDFQRFMNMVENTLGIAIQNPWCRINNENL